MKILFLIHDLGNGGAEKVLVNLVNNLDRDIFDISVISLFGGINEQFLKRDIHYKKVFNMEFRGNSHFLKIMSPEQLHRLLVKDYYDIEVSFLEGPSARIISGCENPQTGLISWIHVEQHTMKKLARSFRSPKEAIKCYRKFDQTVCVSQFVKKDFLGILNQDIPACVLYNTVESDKIRELSLQPAEELDPDDSIRLISVGTLKKSKGYMRLLRVMKKLAEEFNAHLYILGKGPLESEMKSYIHSNHLEQNVTLLGYHTNPYKFVAKCDLLVCASFAEGFSTAVTEALILGTPVCTVEVSGMKELLGENEYGIVTENDENALYEGIRKLLSDPKLLEYYTVKAEQRGTTFDTKSTVAAVQDMLMNVYKGKQQ